MVADVFGEEALNAVASAASDAAMYRRSRSRSASVISRARVHSRAVRAASSASWPARVQQAVGGGLAEVQQLGDLPGRPGHGVAQDQHRPLARRQVLDCREVCQLDRLARLDDDRRLVVRRSRHLQQPVGVRLEPRATDGAEVGVQDLFRRRTSGGMTRFGRRASASRHAFVAMR